VCYILEEVFKVGNTGLVVFDPTLEALTCNKTVGTDATKEPSEETKGGLTIMRIVRDNLRAISVQEVMVVSKGYHVLRICRVILSWLLLRCLNRYVPIPSKHFDSVKCIHGGIPVGKVRVLALSKDGRCKACNLIHRQFLCISAAGIDKVSHVKYSL
jgi:hypothetical protein